MNGLFYIGSTSLSAQDRGLGIIANNISNINSVAYKRQAANFSELVSVQVDVDGEVLPPQPQMMLPSGVTGQTPRTIWDQGDLKQTGRALDIAIDGDGFLEVLGPSGRKMLWRGGELRINADGYLAASDGSPLAGMILVPDNITALDIAGDGSVTATLSGENGTEQLGKLELVRVTDPASLANMGGGYYQETAFSQSRAANPGEDGAGYFRQGMQETSNVDLADEMVSLLLLQRSYAASAQLVKAGDQLMALANDLRG